MSLLTWIRAKLVPERPCSLAESGLLPMLREERHASLARLHDAERHRRDAVGVLHVASSAARNVARRAVQSQRERIGDHDRD